MGLAHIANLAIPNGVFAAPFFITAVMITAHLAGIWQAGLGFVLAGAMLDYFDVPPTGSLSTPARSLAVAASVRGSVRARGLVHQRTERRRAAARARNGGRKAHPRRAVLGGGRSSAARVSGRGARVTDRRVLHGGPGRNGHSSRRARLRPGSRARIIPPKHGIIGQAVADARSQIVSVPPDYITVRSSLGHRRASHVVVVPMTDGESTRAVLELGFFGKVKPEALRLFQRIAEPVAIAVRSSTYRTAATRSVGGDPEASGRAQGARRRAQDDERGARGTRAVMLETQRALEQQQVELEQSNDLLREQTTLLEQKNDELARAQEAVRLRSQEADHANRAKSEFLANMSHELRTPLNSSLILAKLLMENRDGNLTPDQIRFAETIYSAGNDLLAMIDEILDLAKIEAGKLELSLKTC